MLGIRKLTETNLELKALIENFNKVKIKYEEVQKYGKFHPDLKQVQLLMQDSKEALYTHELIIEYKKLEKVIQGVLDEVSASIAKAVSEHIKHPNEIGLIPKH